MRRRTQSPRELLRKLLCGTILLAALSSAAQTAAPQPRREALRFGYTRSVLMDVNPVDAEAAVTSLVAQIIRRKDLDTGFETTMYEEIGSLTAAIRAGRIDLISCLCQEYVKLAEEVALDPLFISVREEGLFESLLLLVHREQAASTLADLAGSRLLVCVTQSNEMPVLWLDTMLIQQGLPPSEGFLASIETVVAGSRALLPVFFQRADACIVLKSTFDTAVELNPQVGSRLVALRTSPALCQGLVAVDPGLPEADRQDVVESLGELHLRPAGQQLLSIFRVERFEPFRPEFLDTARQLLTLHRQLRGASLPE